MPSDADQIRDLEEELDALDNPTTAEVLFHTRDYDAGIVAAIGVQRGTAGGEGGGSLPGSSRITVAVSGVPIASDGGNHAIDWSSGTPFIYKVGDALDTDGADVVFVEDGLYAVKVHLPGGVADNGDANARLAASLSVTCGSQNADGDDDWQPAIASDGGDPHAGALTASWVWTQAAGATLGASVSCIGTNDGIITSAICQIVKLSDAAPDA